MDLFIQINKFLFKKHRMCVFIALMILYSVIILTSIIAHIISLGIIATAVFGVYAILLVLYDDREFDKQFPILPDTYHEHLVLKMIAEKEDSNGSC